MDQQKIISADQQRFSARIFNLASMIAVLIPPLLMIWIAASIFAYASVAHHPNPKVVNYNRFAGYRFYGVAGAMVVLGQPIYGLFSNWYGLLAIWAIFAVVVIPWGIRDLLQVQRENWQDMEVEANTHE
ncbi:MAG: hypothetical protein Q7V00_03245 [Sulfurimicrobium sp.]|nr:hypothetical protein [Sulfurimicrobium sp.]MDP1703391.1 hypothetical protein [Sulfurimicrobium sp.]MDP3689069.1 hypothetical protein [Sulfurimicrobium sp.]